MLSLNETWIFSLDSAGMLHESDGDVWQDKYNKQQQQNGQTVSSTNNSTLLSTAKKERIWNRYVFSMFCTETGLFFWHRPMFDTSFHLCELNSKSN